MTFNWRNVWVLYVTAALIITACLSGYAGHRLGVAEGKAMRVPVIYVKTGETVRLYDALDAIGAGPTEAQKKELAKKVRGRVE